MRAAAAALCVLGLALLPLTSGQNAGNLVGTNKPDGNCKPTSTCCCSTGTTSVTSQPPNDSVNVTGDLDGGTGCHGFTSLQSVFSVRCSSLAQSNNNKKWN
jgi:hypothetical protein